MPISLPIDWGKEEAESDEKQSTDKDCDKCEKCDAHKEAMTDLGKIMLQVERKG